MQDVALALCAKETLQAIMGGGEGDKPQAGDGQAIPALPGQEPESIRQPARGCRHHEEKKAPDGDAETALERDLGKQRVFPACVHHQQEENRDTDLRDTESVPPKQHDFAWTPTRHRPAGRQQPCSRRR